MLNYKVFREELNSIKNSKIKQFTEDVLFGLPNYFYDIPASSTGKYHPAFTHCTGGLTRHTKAAIRIAHSLFRTGIFNFNQTEKDIITSALLIHDGVKNGYRRIKYTVKSHPQLLVKFIKSKSYLKCPEPYKKRILEAVRLHMGKWNKKGYDRPKTDLQKFVHLCDYLSSRKWIGKSILKDESILKE